MYEIFFIFQEEIHFFILLFTKILYTLKMHTKKHTILRRIDKKSNTPAQIFSEATPFFITCQAGLESLVKQEVNKLGLKTVEVADRIVRVTGNEKQMYELLVWSRFSNRIYLELAEKTVTTFDELFSLVKEIPWKQYLQSGIAIVTEGTSIKSTLAHTPSLQSITKKAIVEHLTADTGTHHLYEDRSSDEAHIQVFMRNNTAHILLDITGTALHKRGYRLESGEAPIKENLAAALVALSGWRFRTPLYDPFCGSGTIAIEAALLARNLAPGMGRHFAVEYMPFFQKSLLTTVRNEAKKRSYPSGSYQIIGRDIDSKMIDIARANAERAGVEADICFEV